jgi:hypothetical protein
LVFKTNSQFSLFLKYLFRNDILPQQTLKYTIH